VVPVSGMEEALQIAYAKCGAARPRITVMPQGANTFPMLMGKAQAFCPQVRSGV